MKKQKIYSEDGERVSFGYYLWIVLRLRVKKFTQRIKDFRARRPHRSFRLTRRRDAVRPLKLPGYWKFTGSVWQVIKQNKRFFLSILAIIVVFGVVTFGLLGQDFINLLSDTLEETGSNVFEGNWGELGKAGLLLVSVFSTGGLSNSFTELQQTWLLLGLVFVWLVIVWALRNSLAGNKLKLRDALYNAGSPIISTLIVAVIILIQIVPVMISVIIYSAARSTDFLTGGVETMVFAAAVFLMLSLSLYWVTGSFLALVVVAIPGVYPMQAIKIAGNMVVGRRVKIILRVLWCLFVDLVGMLLVLIPVYLIAGGLSSVFEIVGDLAIIPFTLYVLVCSAIIFSFCYIYMLYRGIIDSDARR